MKALVFAVTFVSVFSAGIFGLDVPERVNQLVAKPLLAESVVKIWADRGHGSAVHIGNGYYLTAAHVVGDYTEMNIKTGLGDEGSGVVLWSAKEYDVALIKSDDVMPEASSLDCRNLEIGEAVSLKGNPLNLEFQTTWGRISGASVTVGPWKVAVPVDATLGAGMSGGPVFDAAGNLVGLNVGAMVQRMGFAGSLVGISYIVPSAEICGLLGLLA